MYDSQPEGREAARGSRSPERSVVDLRSDTVTRPTPAMLSAMVAAEVGDDVLGDDPTVAALEARAAALTGKEAALFTPSGTMANQIAIRCWTQPGDEVLMEDGGHPFHYEAGAAAVVSGVQLRTLPGEGGLLSTEAVAAAVRPDDVHCPPTTLVILEDTANRGGGRVYPLALLEAHGALARRLGLRLHLDGARVFNAAVAQGLPLARLAAPVDSLCFCLSKGLGAPVGSVLCGPADFIRRARRVRKLLGGGMRQAGYLAAAGLHALDHHVERLAEDHRRARELARGLEALGLIVDEPETNMVYVDLPPDLPLDAAALAGELAEQGVRCLPTGPRRLRLVTHLDVDDAGIAAALEAFAAALPATAADLTS